MENISKIESRICTIFLIFPYIGLVSIWRRDSESLFFCGTATPTLRTEDSDSEPKFQTPTSGRDVWYTDCVFQDEWRENLSSFNERCMSVYNSVQARPARTAHRPKPRTNIVITKLNVGLQSQSRPLGVGVSLRRKTPTPTPHPWTAAD